MGARKKEFNLVPGLFLIGYHTLLLFSLPLYLFTMTPSWSLILVSIVLYFASGISITAGYHRLYSHKAYKAHPVVESLLLFFGTMAVQGSALRWSFEHRLHHAHVDGDKDPYSIKKGFWYAHMLWLFEKPQPIEKRNVSDLMNNKLVVFQDRFYPLLMVAANAIAWGAVYWLTGDPIGSFVIAVLLRMFCLHHSTWFINSLAHMWGVKPFSQELSAVDNYIISLLTFGEGYHNYHHTFANDYRNGIRWYHFDPTKWMIWIFSKTGLVYGLKRTDAFTVKKRMLIEQKEELTERLKHLWYVKSEELEGKIQEISDKILSEIQALNQLRQRYREYKNKEIYIEMKRIQKQIKEDWKSWKQLDRTIWRMRPLPLAIN